MPRQWDHCLAGGTLGGREGASPGSLSGSLASLLVGASWGRPKGLPSCSIIFTWMLPQRAMLKRVWAVGWKSGDHAWEGNYKIGHKNTNGLHGKIETPRHTVVPLYRNWCKIRTMVCFGWGLLGIHTHTTMYIHPSSRPWASSGVVPN